MKLQASQPPSMAAATHLYHTLFTGLILTVVTRRGGDAAARWMEALFRTQHHAKFLSSFEKLGLSEMPPAVACAAYHYLSNRIGGVDVEFMADGGDKAWVRFPPPRWVYPGAAICAIPTEVSRAMLRGWYAQNGVSLGVPGLGFICTGQTVDAQAGLMGYFQDHSRALAPEERLRFAPGEVAPPFDPAMAPEPPPEDWPPERLGKARRNYAMEYLKTGLPLLFQTFGVADGLHLGRTACWLIGVQLAHECAAMAGIGTDGRADAARLIAALAEGEGGGAEIAAEGPDVLIHRTGLRLFTGMEAQPPEVFTAWAGLHEGLVAGIDRFSTITAVDRGPDRVTWRIAAAGRV